MAVEPAVLATATLVTLADANGHGQTMRIAEARHKDAKSAEYVAWVQPGCAPSERALRR